jgi:AhpD family alkylhydroperoxidase
MSNRIGLEYPKLASKPLNALLALSQAVKESGLPPGLLDLVDLRASQINGCGFCLEMHVAEAELRGESAQRLHAVTIWRESSRFTPQEKAALAWTEAVTRLEHGVSDAEYTAAREHFSDAELVALTFAIGTINMFNRLNVSLGVPSEQGREYVLKQAHK